MNHAPSDYVKQLASAHRKTILLIDVNATTRELRAKSLRSRGVIVDCEDSAEGGFARFESGTYHLVLLDLGADKDRAESLATSMRRLRENQKVAFFVEGPAYISFSQNGSVPHLAPRKVAKVAVLAPPPAEETMDFGERVRKVEAEREQQSAESHTEDPS